MFKKATMFFTFSVALSANAQWSTDGSGRMSSSNSGNVGIGTTEPRRKLEVNNALMVSAAPLKSGLILNAAALPTDNDWSNIHLIAGSTGGSGWLKTYMENHGGYFNWTVNSPSGEKELVRIHASTGNVGIGTADPISRLDVRGGFVTARNNNNAVGAIMEGTDGGDAFFGSVGAGAVSLGNANNWRLMNILPNGDIGIGTTTPRYKLAVNGDIGAKKVKVTQDNWPDYVFDSNYQLPTLKEVEQYILRHKHLPGIISAEEIKENDLDLGDNQSAMLKKIEELTLYAIDQDKKISAQQSEMDKMKKDIEVLRKQTTEIAELKAMLETLKVNTPATIK